MPNYAFTDANRKKIIYANANDIMNYKSVRCYCRNPKCNARMFIYDPEHPNKAYFKASGNPHHSGACGIALSNFNRSKYNEAEFRFPDNFLYLLNAVEEENINHNTNRNVNHNIIHNNINPIRTLKELYNMLINTGIDDTYNNYPIRDIIADERTASIYGNTIIGIKLVECNFYRFDKNKIIMNYPLFTPNSDKLNHIELRFNEGSPLFSKVLNYVKGKKHNGIIIVFGNFTYDNENEISYVNITSLNQIAVIKKETPS